LLLLASMLCGKTSDKHSFACLLTLDKYSEAIELNRFEIRPTESASIRSSLIFKDENLSIFAVPISPIGSTSTVNAARSRSRSPSRSSKRASSEAHDITIPPIERVLRQMFCGDSSLPDGTFERRTPLDWRLHRSALPRAPRATTVAAYIGLGPVVRGKFNAKRATELGILGPARALLTKGQSVLAKDGVTMVTPDMCIGPNIPASVRNVLCYLSLLCTDDEQPITRLS
jgi:ribonuclease Z